MRQLAILALVAACSPDEVRVLPVLDLPVDDDDADPFARLDEIEVTVARAGDDRDLVTRTFARGEPLELGDVPFGEDLVIHVYGYTQDILSAYGRTCAFDLAPDDVRAPHLFFARTAKHARMGVTPLPRIEGGGVSFGGTAVLVGGRLDARPVLDVERFDPATGALETVARLSERDGAAYAQLGTSIAVLGGQVGSQGATFIELLDGERFVVESASTRTARIGMSATSLSDGRVIVAGGNVPGSAPVSTLSELALDGPELLVRDLRATLAFPRAGHTATRLGSGIGAPILIAGGTDAANAPIATAELYKPLQEVMSPLQPAMFAARVRHRAAPLPDGSVLVVGGLDEEGDPVLTIERFTLDAGFETIGQLPENAGVVDLTVTVLPDGRILFTGGRPFDAAPPTASAFIARLDPLDASIDIVPTDPLAVPRAGHQAALLCDGTVFITGGTPEPAAAERYNPSDTGRR